MIFASVLWGSFAPRRIAPRRTAPRRTAPLRSAPRRAALLHPTPRRSALCRTIGIVAVCATTVARIESATGCETMISPTSPRASSEPKKAATSAGGIFASTTRKFAPAASRCPMPASKKPVTVSSAGGASGGARERERKRASARLRARARAEGREGKNAAGAAVVAVIVVVDVAAVIVVVGGQTEAQRRVQLCEQGGLASALAAAAPARAARRRVRAHAPSPITAISFPGSSTSAASPEEAIRRGLREPRGGCGERTSDGVDDEPRKEAVVVSLALACPYCTSSVPTHSRQAPFRRLIRQSIRRPAAYARAAHQTKA